MEQEQVVDKRKQEIVDYYETCQIDYKLLWNLETSLAMHAGYWDHTTQTLHQALMRENQVLAEEAAITSADHVLDAGCGIGGSSIYLAKHYGCKVVGITISPKQIEEARKQALRHVPMNLPLFYQMDFNKTTFPDSSFDVVWGIESICHAYDKSMFIKEAFRLLKPGGRLVVADGFIFTRNYTPEENELMSQWLRGWGVESLAGVQSFHKDLKDSGFSNVTFKDVTSNVIPSSKRLFFYSIPAFFLSRLGELTGLRTRNQTNNIKSAYYQYKAITSGLWHYGIFRAEKPR